MFSHRHDIHPISKVKASFFETIQHTLIVAQAPAGNAVVIEMLDDPEIISEWWDEDLGEFVDY